MGAPTVQCQKDLFRALGGTASALFALQAVWVFLNPPDANLWKVCHWLGQALLCVLAGLAGCYLEVKGGRALLEAHLAKFTLNRLFLSIFYFWLGCYIMDVANYNFWQVTLARGTGLLAWLVAVGDIIVSCACEAREEDLPGAKVTPSLPMPAQVPGKKALDVDLEAVKPSAPAPAGGWNSSWTHKDAQAAGTAPTGGWNTAWTNPFGNS